MTDGAARSGVRCVCGAAGPVGARFCASCGRPLVAAPTEPAASRPEPVASRPEPVEERRLVTALFADLSGFTSLAARLDTEELLDLVDPLIAEFADIVTGYGGYLEKFAGDALLALFGAPVAHEDDAVRALRAAADMHALIERRGQDAGLTVHIGVNTGPVVARSIASGGRADYAVLGESVILAQRLQALAPPGQTYAGELTRDLAGSEFELEPLGAHPVKGRTEPVPVFRVRGPRTGTRAAGTRTGLPRMIGRPAELATVAGALERARAGHTVIVQLSGPAGSGKSRLLAELRGFADASGVRTVEIVGASYQRSAFRRLAPLFAAALLARYPGAESTEQALERLDADPDAPATGRYTAMLMGRADPARPPGDLVAQGVRRELVAAAGAWLTDLCGRHPVAILVDNRQWIEASSVELLDEVVSARTDRPLLVCLSGRQPPKPRDSGESVTVELGPIDQDGIAELIVDEVSARPDRRLVDFVSATSRGNPLMARELTRLLRDDGLLDARLGHVRLVAGAELHSVPTNLRTLLAAQIDGLPAGAVRVATAAAAIGLLVPFPLLAEVLGDDGESLGRHVDELVDAGFLTWASGPGGAGELRFDSPPLRDLLYARMTGRRRRAMHGRIADVLGADPDAARSPALLAAHRYLAGDAAGALPLLRHVADQARQVFAHDDAVLALTRAIDAAESARPDLLPDLLGDLADVRFELGEYEEAAQLYQRAQRSGGDARAWAGEGACLRRLGEYEPAGDLLRRALDGGVGGDSRLVWAELAATRSVSGDLDGSIKAARAGLAMGRADDGVAGRLQSQLVRSLTLTGRLDEARVNADLAVENLRRAGDLAGQCAALRLLGSLQQTAGALTDAADTLESGLALAERAGVVEEIGGCLINLGIVRGELDEHRASADCYARAAATFEQTGNRAGQATAHGNRAYALWRLGDPGTAREVAGQALGLARQVGNHYAAADISTTLALIAESESDPATAVRWATAARDEFTAAGMPDAAADSQDLADRLGS